MTNREFYEEKESKGEISIWANTSEIETIRFCVSKMLEVNKLEHGEICASILTGAYDRTEEFQRVLTKLSTLK
jgi:hypothetical protein